MGGPQVDASHRHGGDIQTQVYAVGKRHQCFNELRERFTALYQILLGQDASPRLGSFVALYGIRETVALLDRAIVDEVCPPSDRRGRTRRG